MEALGHATVFGLLVASPEILTVGSRQSKQFLAHYRLSHTRLIALSYHTRAWTWQGADWDKPFSVEYIYTFSIELTHMDRDLYATLDLRVAQQPSETLEYMLTRVLAYCLEYREGIVFSPGISAGDQPAILARDLTGQITLWVEVGAPDAERLHRGSKSADRVAVYTYRDIVQLKQQLAGSRIHRAEEIPIYVVERSLLDALIASIERRTTMGVVVTEGQLYIQIGGNSIEGALAEHRLG